MTGSPRQAARFAVSKALTTGALVRQPCARCGKTTRVEAHHEDYAAPLTVTWLCHLHHVARHQERIAAGLDSKPIHGKWQVRPVSPSHLLTVVQAADYLNLTPKALRRRIDRRAVPFTRLGPRTIRFSQFTLDVWMRESQRYAERRSA